MAKVEPITDAHYERIKEGLRVLKGGALGRYGFYHQGKDQHSGSSYRGQPCYASLAGHSRQHAGEILYVGFNDYNEKSGSHHVTGSGKKGSEYARRVELEWLTMLVGKDTPFPKIVGHLHQANPSKIQEDGGFIFKDMRSLPNKEFNCFIICARLCYEYGPTADVYLFLRDREHTRRISALIATGMRPKPYLLEPGCEDGTWELFSPCHTYIGGNITGYAYRWLYARPKTDTIGLGGGAYGSAQVYCEGSIDMYSPLLGRTFEGVKGCIKHLKAASEEQRKKCGDKK